MNVFITGASGFIGSNVCRELQARGHAITGLARSDKSAAALEAKGIRPVRGDIADTDVLQREARAADGTIHCAFNHDDLTKFLDNAAVEEKALDALTAALEGSNKPLVISGGVLGVENERVVQNFQFPRIAAIYRSLDSAKRGVKVSLVRNAPVTHGPGDVHGFIPTLIKTARMKGIAGYVGAGDNLWPASDVRDTATLYRMAFEAAPAGSVLHAVGDEGVSTKTIAELIGKKLGVPVQPIADPEPHFGAFFARVMQLGARSSNAITKELLGWQPTHPGLVADLEAGNYFTM
ncbi:MAG: SDR family oxidoreductase [Kofleriaceae bacterium]